MKIARLTGSDQLIYSTVRIQTTLPNDMTGTGTGFFYIFFHKDTYIMPVIVTNKHVIEGAISATIHFHIADEQGNILDGQYKSLEIPNFTQRCVPHPDPDVDLCIWLIADLLNWLSSSEKVRPFYRGLHTELIPNQDARNDLLSIENILVIGYPNNIWDDVNNMPIARRGITATPPYVKYEGKETFLIDAPLSNGSSGSPVFLYNEGFYTTRAGHIIAASRIMLLGIVSAMYPQKVEGDFVNKNSLVSIFENLKVISEIPMNLGLAIWSEKLMDFEPILEPLHQQAIKEHPEIPNPPDETDTKQENN